MTKIFYTDTSPLFNDVLFEECAFLLPLCEKEKIKKLKHRQDKNLKIGAWMMLDMAIKDFSHQNTVPEIVKSKKGKPFFKENCGIYFNLSHSGDIALCAVSDKEVGADVQCTGDFKEGVCRRFFTKNECSYVLNGDEYTKQDRFFKIWTLKEAYAKMTGEGLASFRDFEIELPDGKSVRTQSGISDISLEEAQIPGYRMAVCTSGCEDEFVFCKINLYKLLIK